MTVSDMRIFTIGYEGATVPEFIAALQKAGVERVIDVRALPLSRRPGFSKSSLSAALEETGIEYVHLKALGTPAAGRAAARAGRFEDLKRIYTGQLELPEAMVQSAQHGDRSNEPDCCEEDATCRPGEESRAGKRADVVEYVREETDESAPHGEHAAPDTPGQRGTLQRHRGHGLLLVSAPGIRGFSPRNASAVS